MYNYIYKLNNMRLVTRFDFDGLACGMLLKDIGVIDSFKFVHPKDLQDGLFKAYDTDILANVPYVRGCGMWFNRHFSEDERVGWNIDEVKGIRKPSRSTARLIYEYFNKDNKLDNFNDFLDAVDKFTSADLKKEEILNPKGWIMLGFLMDPRTGIGRFHDFHIDDYPLKDILDPEGWMLLGYLSDSKTGIARTRDFRINNFQLVELIINEYRNYSVEKILELDDIKERIDFYYEQQKLFKDMIKKYTKKDNNLIITDLRDIKPIYSGNRFLMYTMFDDTEFSIWIVDGKDKKNVSIAIGKNIFNKRDDFDIGRVLLKYNGGGNMNAGTCQVNYNEADEVIKSLKNDLIKNSK